MTIDIMNSESGVSSSSSQDVLNSESKVSSSSQDFLKMCIKEELQKIKDGYKGNSPIDKKLEELKQIKSVTIKSSDGNAQTIILWGPNVTRSGELPKGSKLSSDMQTKTNEAVGSWIGIGNNEFDKQVVENNIKALITLITIKRDNSSSLTGAKKIHEQTLVTLNKLLSQFTEYNNLISRQSSSPDDFIRDQISKMTFVELKSLNARIRKCFSEKMPNADTGQIDQSAEGTILAQISKIVKDKTDFDAKMQADREKNKQELADIPEIEDIKKFFLLKYGDDNYTFWNIFTSTKSELDYDISDCRRNIEIESKHSGSDAEPTKKLKEKLAIYTKIRTLLYDDKLNDVARDYDMEYVDDIIKIRRLARGINPNSTNPNSTSEQNKIQQNMKTLLTQLSDEIIKADTGGRRTKRRKLKMGRSVKKMRPNKKKKQNTKMNKQRGTYRRRR